MQIRFREGEKAVLPDGSPATIARRHQFVGVPWGGEYKVMTGEPDMQQARRRACA